MEDIPEHAFLVQHALVSLGFLTVVCHNTFRGIDMVRQKEFDVIVTDLRMPEMGGVDFIRYVRMFDKHTPIVVISAYADVEAKSETLKVGANYFISKPFRPSDIKNVFEQFK